MAVIKIDLLLVFWLTTSFLTCKPTPKCIKEKVILKDSLPIEEYITMYQDSLKRRAQTQNLPRTMRMTTAKTGKKQEIPGSKIKCGSVVDNDVQAVIHGHNAPEKSYPWQVYIRSQATFCGGVLISSRWVLTAAHCIDHVYYSYIVFGTKDLRNRSPISVVRFPVKVIVHEQFNVFNNDIALVKFNFAVNFSDYIRPACIPVDDNSFEEAENCYLTGWGRIDFEENSYTSVLQEVGVDIISNDECYIYWSFIGREISSDHLCTSIDTDEPTGACNGDSGGPISCLVNSTFYVVAVASRVEYGCQKKFLPDVYTRVSFYRQWINKTMSEN